MKKATIEGRLVSGPTPEVQTKASLGSGDCPGVHLKKAGKAAESTLIHDRDRAGCPSMLGLSRGS
jgi:hypothetical protein